MQTITLETNERYKHLEKGFIEKFGRATEYENGGNCTIQFFSAPGRSEIIGNHTDHNGGKVIAAAIDMDTIAAAAPNETDIIRIYSEGHEYIEVDLKSIADYVNNYNTDAKVCYLYDGSRSLVAGICTYIMKNGFDVGGFDAYVTTQVIPSAGVSSSASYEMLICAIINFMFNDNKMTENDCAKAGLYAENEFWHKSSGLMDQITCAVGGAVYMDFSDENEVKFMKKNLSFEKFGYSLVIVNTGKGHADLSEEYSAIPKEMFSVAEVLGCKRLCETNIDELMKVILNHDSYNDAGSILHSDRAVLRAIHFFEENERVDRMAEAIDNDDFDLIKRMIDESGKSSWELLQNCYCPNNPSEQKISLALTLTGRFLKGTDSVCRVHGGGFAGVIMCILPVKDVYSYKDYMEHIFGKGNVYVASIRNYGAVKVELV